jgi:hypothetical protein
VPLERAVVMRARRLFSLLRWRSQPQRFSLDRAAVEDALARLEREPPDPSLEASGLAIAHAVRALLSVVDGASSTDQDPDRRELVEAAVGCLTSVFFQIESKGLRNRFREVCCEKSVGDLLNALGARIEGDARFSILIARDPAQIVMALAVRRLPEPGHGFT